MAFDEEDLTKKGINGVYDQLDFDGAVRSSSLCLGELGRPAQLVCSDPCLSPPCSI